MQVLAHRRLLGHDLDELFGHVVGVWRGEAHPPDAVDAGDVAQKSRAKLDVGFLTYEFTV